MNFTDFRRLQSQIGDVVQEKILIQMKPKKSY